LSVELPEAYILAQQINKELIGKQVSVCKLQNCQKLQDLGFINMYATDFERLIDCKVEAAVSRGNTIHIKFDRNQNLILAPEYGGVTLFHPKNRAAPSKFTFKTDFTDESAMTVTLTGMGIIQTLPDEDLGNSYVYRRDFSKTVSPIEADFTFERFQADLKDRNVNVKAVLVGKDAAVVGLGNAIFQDILYKACIHPKHKASDLNSTKQRALYDAVRFVIGQRIKFGGKTQFMDFYGKQGAYVAAMGSNMKGKICPKCGADVSKLSLGGGQVYFCPSCQT
jgi:formamidopyrimidine-DNA glycosylase